LTLIYRVLRVQTINERIDICQWGSKPLCPFSKKSPITYHSDLKELPLFKESTIQELNKLPLVEPLLPISKIRFHETEFNCLKKRDGCLHNHLYWTNMHEWETKLLNRAWQCQFKGKLFHIFSDHVIQSITSQHLQRGSFVKTKKTLYNLVDDFFPPECQGKDLEHNRIRTVENSKNLNVFRLFWTHSNQGPVFCGIFQHPDLDHALPHLSPNQYVPCIEI
jgi:hypothetical protein